MRWLLNTVYACLLLALSPMIAWRVLRQGRYRRGLAEKFFGLLKFQGDGRPVVWFHAVSVGEVIQLRKVVDEFRRQADDRFCIVISASTDSGFDLASTRFPGCHITWFPLDFSWAVSTALNRIRPELVVLMELELWPGFLAECRNRDIPVAVVNARLSERSHRRYLKVRQVLKPVFSSLSLVAAQSQSNADRLASLGVPTARIHVTGSVKFDGVECSRDNPGTQRLRQLFDLSHNDPVLVAGSTQDPEERLILDTWQQLRNQFPNLQLVLVPRHLERFNAVARLIEQYGFHVLRRSTPTPLTAEAQHTATVRLLDTIGELSSCWGLADIAFVGGSFGNRGGQNMIEPAAYGSATLFGPNTWNFRDVVRIFQEASACQQLQQPAELLPTIHNLLNNAQARTELGEAARRTVQTHQGATAKTAQLLLQQTSLIQFTAVKVSARAA